MATADNLADALDALSARLTAIEGALIAPAPQDEQDRFDGYNGLPVPESFLDLLRQSFEDIRALIDSTNIVDQRHTQVGNASACIPPPERR